MKKLILYAFITAAVAFVITVALWGRRYYNDRYVGADYYAVVPSDYDMTEWPLYSSSGAEIGTGVTYRLVSYDENGEAKDISFTVYSPESGLSRGEIQPPPGTYLCVSASKQIVLRWRVIEEEEVPAAALALIYGE